MAGGGHEAAVTSERRCASLRRLVRPGAHDVTEAARGNITSRYLLQGRPARGNGY